jgi:hypothetical protein
MWFVVVVVGFGLMCVSYYRYVRVPEPAPWFNAFMCVGREAPAAAVEGVEYTEAALRWLPARGRSREFAKAVGRGNAKMARGIEQAFSEKAVLLPALRDEFVTDELAVGRMPEPGKAEVLAGAQAAHQGEVRIGERVFRVVGSLNRSVILFADAYLLAPDAAGADLFAPSESEAQRAYVFRGVSRETWTEEVREQFKTAFADEAFSVVTGDLRVGAGPFALYIAGMAIMLLGGSALFVRLYAWLGPRVRNRVLGPPLAALGRWRGLLAGLHAVVFGTYVLASVLTYAVPELQALLGSAIVQSIQSGSGPLGLAGKAYATGSILYAAAVTLGVNFLVGSLLSITAPSVVLPGVGALMTWFRGTILGFVLAPTGLRLAQVGLPHSFTILVEMEAYIVAGFFGLLIPIYLFRKREGPTVLRRWGRALLLNVQSLVLVFALLAVVALYEAIEVILQMR